MAQQRRAEGASLLNGRARLLSSTVALTILLAAGAGPASAAGAGPTGPPVVSETFTLLPCTSASTTIAIEGCAEHRLLALDRQINTLSRRIYNTLDGAASRHAFVTAAHGWVKSRRAGCLRESDANAGGTLAPIVFVNCEVTRDRSRVAYLTHRLRALRAKHH